MNRQVGRSNRSNKGVPPVRFAEASSNPTTNMSSPLGSDEHFSDDELNRTGLHTRPSKPPEHLEHNVTPPLVASPFGPHHTRRPPTPDNNSQNQNSSLSVSLRQPHANDYTLGVSGLRQLMVNLLTRTLEKIRLGCMHLLVGLLISPRCRRPVKRKTGIC